MRHLTYILLLSVSMALALGAQGQSQKQVRSCTTYYYNSLQIWMGLPPTLWSITHYDQLGRRVEKGSVRDGKFCPNEFWEYDVNGNWILEYRYDTFGKLNSFKKSTFDAQGRIEWEYYRRSNGQIIPYAQYLYKDNRLWQKWYCSGEYNTYIFEEWQYDSITRSIRHLYCHDSLGNRCDDHGIIQYDPKLKNWFQEMHVGSIDQTVMCVDSTCADRYYDIDKHWKNGKWNHGKLVKFDAAGHLVQRKGIDSTNGSHSHELRRYDAQGNLVETTFQFSNEYWGTLLQRLQFDQRGRILLQANCGYDGKETSWQHWEYDPLGHLILQWTTTSDNKKSQQKSYQYDALGRCVAISDSANNLKELLEYDAQGNIYRKRFIVLRKHAPALQLYPPFSVTTMLKKEKAKRVKPKVGFLSRALPFKPSPESSWDTTNLGFRYDEFDSLAELHRVGFKPIYPYANGGREDQIPIGSLLWVNADATFDDTLAEGRSGDTLLQTIVKYAKPDQLGWTDHGTRRKVWKLNGEPLQIQEFDEWGNRIVFWQHEDYGRPYPPRPFDHWQHPLVNWDSVARRHTLEIVQEFYSTTKVGDTLYRTMRLPHQSQAVWQWRKAYVKGKLVKEELAKGISIYYKYDWKGRLLAYREYSTEGGSFRRGAVYSYPKRDTVMVHSPIDGNRSKYVYRLEYWE